MNLIDIILKCIVCHLSKYFPVHLVPRPFLVVQIQQPLNLLNRDHLFIILMTAVMMFMMMMVMMIYIY